MGENFCEGDKRNINNNNIIRELGKEGGGEGAGIDFLEIGDARIIEEFGMELAMTDIDAGGRESVFL